MVEKARVYGSSFVGCAVLDERGEVFGGCNVEHRFRSHDIHAETNALGSLVAGGGTELVAIFVASARGWTPCGSCLDWIFELGGPPCAVLVQSSDRTSVSSYLASELMPFFPAK